MTFLGLTRADNTLLEPAGMTAQGVPIYQRAIGTGFNIVVEGKPGANRSPLGNNSFDPDDPPTFPDLQIQVDHTLGNGSPAVCDKTPPDDGGVPAVNPPNFNTTRAVANAVNDLGCRFINGSGAPKGRPSQEACVLFPDGDFAFVDPKSTLQFCAQVARAIQFPVAQTLVSVRLRDVSGAVGPVARIIVSIRP